MVAASAALCIGALGGPACQRGEPEAACDPEVPTCTKNVLVSCDTDAGVVETPCDPGRCAFDAPVPRCVPAGALPCDSEATPATCENGQLLACTPETGYRLLTDCGAGQLCALTPAPAHCAPVEEQRCQPATFSPLCVAGRRIECDAETERLAETGHCEAP